MDLFHQKITQPSSSMVLDSLAAPGHFYLPCPIQLNSNLTPLCRALVQTSAPTATRVDDSCACQMTGGSVSQGPVVPESIPEVQSRNGGRGLVDRDAHRMAAHFATLPSSPNEK